MLLAPLAAILDRLNLQLIQRSGQRGEQVRVGMQRGQLVIVELDGDLGLKQMPHRRHYHVSFPFAPFFKQLR